MVYKTVQDALVDVSNYVDTEPLSKTINGHDIPTPNVNIGVSDTVYAGIRARNAASAARGVEAYDARKEAQMARDQARIAANERVAIPEGTVDSKTDYRGLSLNAIKGTGLSRQAIDRLFNDKAYRTEMVETYLTGKRIRGLAHKIETYQTASLDMQNRPGASEEYDATVNRFKQAINIQKFLHHDLRDALNVDVPQSLKGMQRLFEEKKQGGWRIAGPDDAYFHQNKDTITDLKYVHTDGREVVYDGDTKLMMTDVDYRGTFNYGEGVSDHIRYDIIPWIDMGVTRENDLLSREDRVELAKAGTINKVKVSAKEMNESLYEIQRTQQQLQLDMRRHGYYIDPRK